MVHHPLLQLCKSSDRLIENGRALLCIVIQYGKQIASKLKVHVREYVLHGLFTKTKFCAEGWVEEKLHFTPALPSPVWGKVRFEHFINC